MFASALLTLKLIVRLPVIGWNLGRAGALHHLARITILPPWLRRLCLIADKAITFGRIETDAGVALCNALQRLGPGFIKFGQALSTRADLIGPELALGLSELQDRLPPFSARLARRQIEAALQAPLETVFPVFDDVPVAAASIAQVHKATLATGEVVAVKLLRPDIGRHMRKDIDFFLGMAELVSRLTPALARLRLVEAVREFEQLCEIELDLRMEAAAGGRLAENLAQDEGIRIPSMYLEYCTQTMLVSQWVDGLRLDDIDGLVAQGHDIEQLTKAAAASFFNQVFRDGYFHADMHPGNVFVDKDGLLVPIDFGIMGHLAPQDRLFLGRLMIAILDRDYDEVARLHAEAGMISHDVPLHLFSQNIRAVIEPLLGKMIGDVSLGQIMGQILKISTRFDIAVQPQFNLLQKTIVMAEGVARQLNPAADMWALSRPFAADWIKAQTNPEKLLNDARHQIMRFARLVPVILDRLESEEAKEQPVSQKPQKSLSSFTMGAVFIAILWIIVHNYS
ncbi:MAG: 2-polyprenylphenol 6-hydroxylase [Candidatus Puniceispirillaceae bacterium]